MVGVIGFRVVRAVACSTLLLSGALGCGGEHSESERLGQSQQAVTTSGARVLGFETPTADWSGLWASPQLVSSTTRTEGGASLALSGGGWMSIASARIAKQGPAPTAITLDVRLPVVQPNPYWLGQAELYLDAPSIGLNEVQVGSQALTGKPIDQFFTLTFPLAASIQTALQGSYSDLRVHIVLNVPGDSAGTYNLDNLTVGPTCTPQDDANPCTVEACDPTSGLTTHTPVQSCPGSPSGQTGPNAEILGFEITSGFSISSGNLTLNSERVEGGHSLAATGFQHASLQSPPLSTLGTVTDTVGFDLLVPSRPFGSADFGSVQLFLEAPSRNVYNAFVGQKNLDGAVLGRFRRVEFQLPAAVKTALASGQYGDLRFKIQLDLPAVATDALLFDRFTFNQQSAVPPLAMPSIEGERTLGFETAASWKALEGGSLALSDDATQGNYSVALSGFTHTRLVSARLGSLGATNGKLAFDLKVPPPASSTGAGWINAFISVPSRGVYSQYIGGAPLTGLPATFNRLSFALPSNLRQQLETAGYDDLSVELTLDVPSGSGTYLFDGLTFGQLSLVPAPAAEVWRVDVNLPAGLALDNVALYNGEPRARPIVGAFGINSPAKVETVGGYGAIVSMSAAILDAQRPLPGTIEVGSVYANLSGANNSRATIHGDFKTGFAATGTGTVTGSQVSGANLGPIKRYPWQVELPSLGAAAALAPIGAGSTVNLAPGAYEGLEVGAGGRVNLVPGNYVFGRINLKPGSWLHVANAQSGPTKIVSRGRVDAAGTVEVEDLPHLNVFWVNVGLPDSSATQVVKIAGTFAGVVLGGLVHVGDRDLPKTNFYGRVFATEGALVVENADVFGQSSFVPHWCQAGCGLTIGCPNVDDDGDGLGNCEEDNDHQPWTSRTAFNGVRVTHGDVCGDPTTCATIDTPAEVEQCVANMTIGGQPPETQNVYDGWGRDYSSNVCSPALQFRPGFQTCGQSGWSAEFEGFFRWDLAGRHCFALGLSNQPTCVPLVVGGQHLMLTSAQPTSCVNLAAGVHPIRWFENKAANNSSPTLHHRFCTSADCSPVINTSGRDVLLSSLLRPTFDETAPTECEPGSCSALCPCAPGENPCGGNPAGPCRVIVCNYPNQGDTSEVNRPSGTACSNGLLCDGTNDACDSAGTCVPGAAPKTDDGNPCTSDGCAEERGVFHDPLGAGTTCSLGCAGSGICSGGDIRADGSRIDPVCVRDEVPTSTDSSACTVELCVDEAAGTTRTVTCPEPDLTGVTPTGLPAKFLWQGQAGASPPQAGVVDGTLEAMQAAVVRGRLVAPDGQPLQSVRVRALKRPELGETLTQIDGTFSLAVNGGDVVTLLFERVGFLSSQRDVRSEARKFAHLDDITLLRVDPAATAVALDAAGAQLALGSAVADDSGDRVAGVLFPPGTLATLVHPDGVTEEVSGLTVRLTEYTAGGPSAMPAGLPPSSAFTYAIELSADEAGDAEVEFDQPVYVYVDNFLGFPPGVTVPVGFHDDATGAWSASPNGRVIKVTDVTNGIATELDGADGLEIDDSERAKLAQYVGRSLWRVPVQHFSTYDFNWGAGFPPDARAPDARSPIASRRLDDPNICQGSIIEAQNRTVGEAVPIVGTGLVLSYASDRVQGYGGQRQLTIPVRGPSVPDSLQRIDLDISVAGRKHHVQFGRSEFTSAEFVANPTYVFQWDGLDLAGHQVQGAAPVDVKTTFNYAAEYAATSAFGGPSGATTTVPTRILVPISKTWSGTLGNVDFKHFGLGGWSISAQHFYDAENGVLYRGDGSRQDAQSLGALIEPVVGNGTNAFGVEPFPSANGFEQNGLGISYGGSEYGAGIGIEPGGDLRFFLSPTTVPNPRDILSFNPTSGNVKLFSNALPLRSYNDSLAVGPKGDVYVGTQYLEPYDAAGAPFYCNFPIDPKLLKQDPDLPKKLCRNAVLRVSGRYDVDRIAGVQQFSLGYTGDGGHATQAKLAMPRALAFGPDRSLYIAMGGNGFPDVIRKVDQAGTISTIAGGGSLELSQLSDPAEGKAATEVKLARLVSIAVDSQGDLYGVQTASAGPGNNVGRAALFKVDRAGRFSTPVSLSGWDVPPETPAPGANNASIEPVAVAFGNGRLFVAGYYRNSFGSRMADAGWVGYLTPGRTTKRVAGALTTTSPGLALGTVFKNPLAMAVASSGAIYLQTNTRIWRVRSPLPSLDGVKEGDPTSTVVPSPDGLEIYEFDYRGRHGRTVDALTGATLREFGYTGSDALGPKLLAGIIEHVRVGDGTTDVGHATTIRRVAGEGKIEITSPFAQVTTVNLDANGYVQSIENPAQETTTVVHDSSGLITSFQTPSGRTSTYEYTTDGFLQTQRDNPIEPADTEGGANVYLPAQDAALPTITRTSSLNRTIDFSFGLSGDGTEQRQTTSSDGSQSLLSRAAVGSSDSRGSDGTQVYSTVEADPRLGLPARFENLSQTTLPSLATLSIRNSRSAIGNQFDLIKQVDTSCLNGTGTVADCTDGLKTVSTLTLSSATRLGTRTTVTPGARTLTQELDAQSRMTSLTLPGTTKVSLEYDTKGRLASTTQGPRSTLFGYDAVSGFRDSVTSSNGVTTRFEDIDGVGRPHSIGLPDDASIALDYNADGRLTSVTPPGAGAHAFSYNGIGLLKSYAPPLSSAVRYSYNTDRQLEKITVDDPADAATPLLVADPQYDATTGQLTAISMPSGDIGFGYASSTGQLVTLTAPGFGAATPTVGLTQTFDGALVSSLKWSDAASGGVAWHRNSRLLVDTEAVYGASALAPAIKTPAQCATTTNCVSYTYDADGITTGAGALTLVPDAATGRIKTKTVGNIKESLSYNGFGELARQTVVRTDAAGAAIETLFDVVYDDSGTQGARDNLGRLTKRTETVLGDTHTFEYGYNADGRPWLETVTRDGDVVSDYTLDTNGNRTAVSLARGFAVGGTTELSGADIVTDAEDRLSQYGAISFEHDALGRVVKKTEGSALTRYAWDSLGALKSVALPDGKLIEYLTDALGRRVGKRVDGVLQKSWSYRDSLRPAAELDAAGNVISRFVYADGAGAATAPQYVVRSGQTLRVVADQLGSVRLLVDANTGAIVERVERDEFGVVLSDTAPGTVPFGFAGGFYDPDTGLVKFGVREYDAKTGRWASRDPILFGGEQSNLYVYVGNDPINLNDPTGLWVGVDDAVFAGGGALIGLVGRGVGDLLTGEVSGWEDYAAAAVGGAAGGETLLYTANPYLAGAVGGAMGNVTGQGLKLATGKQCAFDAGSLLFDTAFGAATGVIPGRPRIAGINSGRGSALAIFKQMATKARSGAVQSMKWRTAGKMAAGAYYQYAFGQGAAAGALGSTLYGHYSE